MPNINSTNSRENKRKNMHRATLLFLVRKHNPTGFLLVIFRLLSAVIFPRQARPRILRGFVLSAVWGSFIGSFLYLVHPIQAISDHQVILLSLSATSIALVFAAAFRHIWTGNAYSSARQR